jgi:diaminopimelate epimerase
MQPVPFLKMHGLGNDFVVVDARRSPVRLTPAQARVIGDRRRGVGFDQLVVVEPAADGADARLVFMNPDGGEAGACGNGTRCAARLLLEEVPGRGELRLETAGGTLRAWAAGEGRYTVAMAVPRWRWDEIPLVRPCDTLFLPLEPDGLGRPAAVSMGNPHAVFFVEDVGRLDVARLGAELERHPLFPERANVGFAQVLAPDRLRLRVFERGAGLTQACGSGACAALVAARRRGLAGDAATLILDGGELEVAWPGEGPVLMTGPAARAFAGELAPELLRGD